MVRYLSRGECLRGEERTLQWEAVIKMLVANSHLSISGFGGLRCSSNSVEETSRSEIKSRGGWRKGVRGWEIINACMCPGLESIDLRWRCWLLLSLLLFSSCERHFTFNFLLDTQQMNYSFSCFYSFLSFDRHQQLDLFCVWLRLFASFLFLSAAQQGSLLFQSSYLSSLSVCCACKICILVFEQAGHIAAAYRSRCWPGWASFLAG